MDTFVNPLRNSMRNVSNAVKSLPDSLAEGMTKMSDNMGRMSERLGQDIKQSFFKVRHCQQRLRQLRHRGQFCLDVCLMSSHSLTRTDKLDTFVSEEYMMMSMV